MCDSEVERNRGGWARVEEGENTKERKGVRSVCGLRVEGKGGGSDSKRNMKKMEEKGA